MLGQRNHVGIGSCYIPRRRQQSFPEHRQNECAHGTPLLLPQRSSETTTCIVHVSGYILKTDAESITRAGAETHGGRTNDDIGGDALLRDTVGTGRRIVPMHTGDSRHRAVAVLSAKESRVEEGIEYAYASAAEGGGSVPFVVRAFETEGGHVGGCGPCEDVQ